MPTSQKKSRGATAVDAPAISREAVVRTALAVIDESGLENFSLATVASRLQIKTPSLYYHFRDKSEILSEVARIILLDADLDKEGVTAVGDWKDCVISTMHPVRRSILRHPKAAPLLFLYPPRHIAMGGYERFLRFLRGRRIPAELHMPIITGSDFIFWGCTQFEAAAKAHGFALYPIYDPNMYPNLALAKRAETISEDEYFEFTMRRFLDGLIARNSEADPSPPTKARRSKRANARK
jgi:AcrR family transcriptional regulator